MGLTDLTLQYAGYCFAHPQGWNEVPSAPHSPWAQLQAPSRTVQGKSKTEQGPTEAAHGKEPQPMAQTGWLVSFFFFLFFKEDIDSYSPVGPAVLRAQPREVRRAAPLNSLCPWPRRRGEGDGSPPVAGGGGDWGAVSSSGLCLSRPGRGTASVVASWVRGTVLMLVLDSL